MTEILSMPMLSRIASNNDTLMVARCHWDSCCANGSVGHLARGESFDMN